MKKLCIIAIALAGMSANVFAQAGANASATAEIVAAIAISNDVDMNFGLVTSSGLAGTVVLGTDGSRQAFDGAALQSGGTITAAEFTVTGEPDYTYNVTLPANLTILSGTDEMVVDEFTSDPDDDEGVLALGTQTLYVGATLNVGIAQPSGVYENLTGFTVTVNYN